MVAVDGARSAPAARLRRLLRRTLLVAGLAAAGWLLSVLFAGYAVAAEEPAATPPAAEPAAAQPADQVDEPGVEAEGVATGAGEPAHTGVLGSLTSVLAPSAHDVTEAVTHTVTGTVHHTVATITHAVTGTAVQAIEPTTPATQAPETRAPSATERPAPAPARPHAPPVTPASAPAAASAPDHSPRLVADAIPHGKRTNPAGHDGDHAGKRGPGHPVEAPAPVAPGGNSISTAHDSAGGARGAYAALTDAAPLPRPAAGYTTRSRAADVTGRVSGLPATSPD